MAPGVRLNPPPVAAAGGAHLALRRLTKAFGAREVLRGIDLTVAAGEFVAILGPSGGGKSTALRVVAGLEPPTGGEVTIGSTDGRRPFVRVMFQEDRLLPWRSVLDNVALGLSPAERPRAAELIRAVGLAGREGDWPAVLSGGQRQRTALARALAHRPDLLLLDEPFGALDALTRSVMQDLLARLWAATGSTVLLVTHDIEESLLLADRIVTLIDGRITRTLSVPLPRPRHRGDPRLAAWKEDLLGTLFDVAEPSEEERR